MPDQDYGAYRPLTSTPSDTSPSTVGAASTARTDATAAPSPLRSQESFDTYCGQVQSRLSESAARRVTFLRAAYDRLSRLLLAARAVEDAALHNELLQYRAAVKELLDALPRAVAAPASNAWPSVPPPPKPIPLQNIGSPGVPTERIVESPMRALGATSVSATPGMEPRLDTEPAPRLPRHPVRPLLDIEADAIRLREQLREWAPTHPLRREGADLNVPFALRLRAFGCRQRRLEEEAGDTEVAEVTELNRDIIRILDAAGDQEYTVALDYSLDPRPTAYQWSELAERHEETSRAQEAFEWWLAHRGVLTVTDVQPLAEAVAAIQQRFNRLLFRIGARDPFQQQLFDDLRAWAKEAQCYLYSLRPKVPIAELVEKASQLEPAWEQARVPVAVNRERIQALDDLGTLVNETEFGEDTARDEARVAEAILRCRAAHVPASDRRLRDTLLPWAALIESDDRFKDTVREIYLEWERRQEIGRIDLAEEEPDNSADQLGPELIAVRAVTKGKRCLILGGTCREENRRKIQQALELEQLVWPSTKPSDPLSRFDTEIRHADIVALLTRFSRKEWKNAQDICAKEGKPFVHLTTGYGVSQVVRHFYNQIAPEAVESRG